MKRTSLLKAGFSCVLAAAVIVAFSGCSSTGSSSSDGSSEVIRVGATPAPHAEILEVVAEILEEQGYELEIVEFNDYIQPNVAVSDGELDANYFQHITYLDNYNEENGTDLVSAGGIHFEPLCVYAGKTASFDELTEGAQIAVPSDPTNEGRALALLADLGLITLADDAGLTATVNDIVDNPLNLQIVEVEAASLPITLQDVDMAIINGNYAIEAGLDPTAALASEDADSEAAEIYVNVVAVRSGDENSAKIQALIAALQSEEVRSFIEETYGDGVVAVF